MCELIIFEKKMLDKKDLQQISERGNDPELVVEQVARFASGFPFAKLVKPATVDCGIHVFDYFTTQKYLEHFETEKDSYDLLKFVPASGAATRMFKSMFRMQEMIQSGATLQEKEADKDYQSALIAIESIRKFAFYDSLKENLKTIGYDIHELIEKKEYLPILDTLLLPTGMDYGRMPKGLLPFHKDENNVKTAIEEQVAEALEYLVNDDKTVKIHFTISPEHESLFVDHIKYILSKKAGDREHRLKINYSFQKKSTDTPAVDIDNQLFRDDHGNILFRPAGHGALIENLSDLDAEVVFIKNIDNVCTKTFFDIGIENKKLIGGYLLFLIDKIHGALGLLDDGNVCGDDLEEIALFCQEELFIEIPAYFKEFEDIEKIDFLFTILNRPLRVCGMVKNTGEPGGGPFFVENNGGEVSLQIVESSQIDMKDEQQKKIWNSSTHFNPVDIVAFVRNFEGVGFDLSEFVDPETGFISLKSYGGRDLKAMELPGLWNGAMNDWISVFVEVPTETFNPVKEINDLLRDGHQ